MRDRTVALAATAAQDLEDVLAWTEEQFGRPQAARYRALLDRALDRLALPETDALAPALHRTVPHLRRLKIGGRGKHYFVYRVDADGTATVLRLLHVAMDWARHVPIG
jgi:plasmid stabilization system protein ParE